MAQKEDRRVRRTKKLLKDALIELIMEKGYDTITVQDILDRADVGRSTFYAHYDSKDDLLLGDAPYVHLSFEEIREKEGEVQTVPSFLEMFQHVAEQRPLFRAMMGDEGINIVQSAVMNHWRTTLEARFEWLAEEGRPLPFPALVLANFLTGGLMSLIVWWLHEEMPYSPEEMNAMFMQMAWGMVGNGG
jgi:AcrR family transcriptional regulator